MTAVEAVRGPWRAALVGSIDECGYEPLEELSEDEPAFVAAHISARSTVVEIRRAGGGIMPWALVGAIYRPGAGDTLRFEVPHSGELSMVSASTCTGPLGRPLKAGLPIEFAQAVLDGLIRYEPASNRPGQLRVVSAGYDDAESSAYVFERAAALLKWVLLAEFQGAGPTAEDLAGLLDQWSTIE